MIARISNRNRRSSLSKKNKARIIDFPFGQNFVMPNFLIQLQKTFYHPAPVITIA